ncbi:MAG: hypothetical protein ACXAEN_19050, partial [Candidatus Thorarchaeota archaeon]
MTCYFNGNPVGLDVAVRSSLIAMTFTFEFWGGLPIETYVTVGIVYGTARVNRLYDIGYTSLPVDETRLNGRGLNDALSVIIDTDCRIWASASYLTWRPPPDPQWDIRARVWELEDDGWTFRAEHRRDNVDPDALVLTTKLVPMSRGKVAWFWSESDDTMLYWRIWEEGWSSEYRRLAGFPADESRALFMSVVSLSDDTLVVAHARDDLLNPGDSYVSLMKISETMIDQKDVCGPDCEPQYITISRDSLDTIFIYWMDTHIMWPGDIHYWYEMDGWESGIEENIRTFADTGPYPLSASFLATDYSFLVYYDGFYSGIWFASWPTPRSVSSGNSAPWKNLGSAAFPGTYSHLDESISMANGLLSVRQTDLSVPGKNGLDLEISRVYRTPQLFHKSLIDGSDIPYMYYKSPYADLGNGWELSFPWIELNEANPGDVIILHLGNGIRFLLNFPENENRIENHVGMHITIDRITGSCGNRCYVVTLTSGLTYVFKDDGYLYQIASRPSDAKSVITFYYSGTNLDSIMDSIGKIVDFRYEGGKLDKILRGSNLVVEFGYNFEYLETIQDAVGRVTHVSYGPDIPANNNYLMRQIVYPSGAESSFLHYSTVQRGTDAYSFAALDHTIDSASSGGLKKSEFQYMDSDGSTRWTRQKQYEYVLGAEELRRCDDYMFVSASNSMTVIQRDVATDCAQQLGKSVQWFDGQAQLTQTDYYAGDSEDVPSSVTYEYDEWGNIIYERDRLEHETWRTYANTRSHNSYPGGGVLTQPVDKNILYDDFTDYDLSEWRLDLGTTSPYEGAYLDTNNYLISPWSLKVGDSGHSVSREFYSSSDELWVDVAVKSLKSVDHDIYILDQNNNPRLRISFARSYYIVVNHQEWEQTPLPCEPSSPTDPCAAILHYYQYLEYHENAWYTLGLHLKDGTGSETGTVDIYLNGTLVATDIDLWYHSSHTFSKILFETDDSLWSDMWIDSVSINDFTDPLDPNNYFGISIDGLDPGQYAELSSFSGQILSRVRAGSSGRIELDWWHPEDGTWDFMRYGVIRIYDADGMRIFSSPFRIIGAMQYDFVQPRRYSNIEKTSSGFGIIEQDPTRCAWNSDNECILLGEASDLGFVPFEDDFDAGDLDTEEFKLWLGGAGHHGIHSSWLSLYSGPGSSGGGYARLTSRESFSLTKVKSLYFAGEIRSSFYGGTPPEILGDGQPRGLRVGTDGRNAIEFVATGRYIVAAITVSNGFEYRTGGIRLPDGKDVNSPGLIYEIQATASSVEFQINDVTVATHYQNIPTGELNLYLSVEAEDPQQAIRANWVGMTVEGDGWPASSIVELRNKDYWTWPNEERILGAQGIDAHESKLYHVERFRAFRNVPAYLDFEASDLLAQYVYIPSSDTPKELMLQYWCTEPETEDEFRRGAFWGEDLIYTPEQHVWGKSGLGDIPPTDKWSLLLIDPAEAGCDGASVGGIKYHTYGGMVFWDSSSIRDRSSTPIEISGFPPGHDWSVKFFDAEGGLLDQKTVESNQVTFDMYDPDPGVIPIKTYPIEGYFKVYDGSDLVYWSPTYDNIWPGDEYDFTEPDFYPNGEILSHDGYQNRLLGSVEYMLGRLSGQPESGRIESLYKYNARDYIAETRDWASGLSQTYTYDAEDNVETFCDYPVVGGGCVSGHETEYSYDPYFSNAYVTEVQQWADGQSILTQYWYDDLTGALEWEMNPRGYQTDYEFDAIQRLTKVTIPQVDGEPNRPFVEYQYDDVNNKMVYIPERYTMGENRYRTEYFYDELGRTAEVATFHASTDGSGAKYVYELYEYNWLDKVTVRELRRGSDGFLIRRDTSDYDPLGRIIEEFPPDPLVGSKKYEYYDDQNMVVVKYDGGTSTLHEKEYHYDWNGKLLMVKEIEGSNLFETSYDYDEVGNLIQMVNDKSQSTEYMYDSLSRLLLVTFPDGETELYVHNLAGDLERKYDRDLVQTYYTYDSLHRLKRIDFDYPSGNRWTTFDYDANSNVMAKTKYKGGYGFESSIMYQYDERDNVILKQVDEEPASSFGPMSFNMFIYYGYDRSDNLVDVNINPSSGFHIIYDLDEFDRTLLVRRDAESIAGFTYFEDSAIKEITYDSGVKTTYSYYESGLHEQVRVDYFALNYLRLDYDYYDDGFLRYLTHDYGMAPTISQEFQYDELSRLTHFDPDKDDPGILPTTFDYDSVGNREIRLDAAGTFVYHYADSTNRLESIDWLELGQPYPYYEFEYDLNGNLLKETNNDPGYTKCFDYDDIDQLVGYRYTNGIP